VKKVKRAQTYTMASVRTFRFNKNYLLFPIFKCKNRNLSHRSRDHSSNNTIFNRKYSLNSWNQANIKRSTMFTTQICRYLTAKSAADLLQKRSMDDSIKIALPASTINVKSKLTHCRNWIIFKSRSTNSTTA